MFSTRNVHLFRLLHRPYYCPSDRFVKITETCYFKLLFKNNVSSCNCYLKIIVSPISSLAYLTPGFSGAYIANVCNKGALHAARLKQKQVTKANLENAVERLVGGTEKRNQAMAPQEKKVVAYHDSDHAIVGWMLEHTDALLKVTIVLRTSLALGFAQNIPRDQKLYNKEELIDRMCMTLGGRVAESLIFNKVTTGAQNDLGKVTKMAYTQIKEYGMCPKVGLVCFPEQQEKELGRKPYSKWSSSLIDAEARH